MSRIEVGPDEVQVDATIIADGLRMDPAHVQERLRDGTITSRCERGEGEDAGRWRLTFTHEGRRFSIVVDTHGNILQRLVTDVSAQRAARSRRRPAG